MMNTNGFNLMVVVSLLLYAAVVGCAPPSVPSPVWTPPRDDRVIFAPHSSNPSNVLVTITFLNPEETSEKPVVINYHAVFLQRPHTNVFINISPGPTQGVSQCTFSIPRNELANCRVVLAGGDSKPVGEAAVGRELKLGDPNKNMEHDKQ